ncbi:hypothetical protein [Salinispora arenicola]|uniref:hypothetical protein n=1 Tax=Salinispora arenicola TaxID=168697 RepID=UPI0012BCB4A9|nr:hypothetical protein [Salinispora arenicola]
MIQFTLSHHDMPLHLPSLGPGSKLIIKLAESRLTPARRTRQFRSLSIGDLGPGMVAGRLPQQRA